MQIQDFDSKRSKKKNCMNTFDPLTIFFPLQVPKSNFLGLSYKQTIDKHIVHEDDALPLIHPPLGLGVILEFIGMTCLLYTLPSVLSGPRSIGLVWSCGRGLTPRTEALCDEASGGNTGCDGTLTSVETPRSTWVLSPKNRLVDDEINHFPPFCESA